MQCSRHQIAKFFSRQKNVTKRLLDLLVRTIRTISPVVRVWAMAVCGKNLALLCPYYVRKRHEPEVARGFIVITSPPGVKVYHQQRREQQSPWLQYPLPITREPPSFRFLQMMPKNSSERPAHMLWKMAQQGIGSTTSST